MSRPTLVDLNPDEHNQGSSYYPFMVTLDLSSKFRVLNKTDDPNFNVFNVITRTNEPKTLTKTCCMQLVN